MKKENFFLLVFQKVKNLIFYLKTTETISLIDSLRLLKNEFSIVSFHKNSRLKQFC
ncbi:hypothetical protein LEP1GSC116_1921 [Leptospira interrogans serovar Icterohaemorrhagiae str. Verdun HP]|uniref:Uncharacterized protein n=1 Tax=Leptospira interrogans serovar Icterohaemorrhagiae str. Verdun HP TaxID=1049910 RepID=M6RCT5_LEPIR|nr:hypothetical protein LEP1GSC116_1921 [Leptospira interrogans serovar Icterohaemorrhagiae str. Verdun HP]